MVWCVCFAAGWIYNKALNYYKETGTLDIKTLRTKVINNKLYTKENQWVLDYDYDLKDEALRDMIKDVKSNLAKGSFKNYFKPKLMIYF